MEAKTWEDTIMTPWQLSFYHFKLKELKQVVARDQAQISFDAGRESILKEVKEWIESHSQIVSPVNDKRIIEDGVWHLTTARQLYEDEWQAFLKGLDIKSPL